MGLPIHGKEGKLIYDPSGNGTTTVAKLLNWTVDIILDTAEITSCGDTWKTRIGGHNDWTGSASYLYAHTGLDLGLDDLGDVVEGGGSNPLRIEFYLDDTGGNVRVLYGEGTLTGISIAQDMGDVVKVDVTFQGIGAIAWGTSVPSY